MSFIIQQQQSISNSSIVEKIQQSQQQNPHTHNQHVAEEIARKHTEMHRIAPEPHKAEDARIRDKKDPPGNKNTKDGKKNGQHDLSSEEPQANDHLIDIIV